MPYRPLFVSFWRQTACEKFGDVLSDQLNCVNNTDVLHPKELLGHLTEKLHPLKNIYVFFVVAEIRLFYSFFCFAEPLDSVQKALSNTLEKQLADMP